MRIAAQATVAAMKLRTRLLQWYARSHRELPWRRPRDAYRVWVSEIMLQQTRVETVIPFYERFLERFPTVDALASAHDEGVLAAWSAPGASPRRDRARLRRWRGRARGAVRARVFPARARAPRRGIHRRAGARRRVPGRS